MTAPRQATASWWRASSAATTGSSIAPGTRTTSGSGTPHAMAAAVPRATRESVISWCQRVATMARLSPDASTAVAPWPRGEPSPLTRTPPRAGPSEADARARWGELGVRTGEAEIGARATPRELGAPTGTREKGARAACDPRGGSGESPTLVRIHGDLESGDRACRAW